MKSKTKRMICFLILTILVIGGVVGHIFLSRNEVLQERRNPKVSIGVGTDYEGWWEHGEWNISSTFSSSDEAVNITSDGLFMEADSLKITDGKISSSLSILGEYVDGTSLHDFGYTDLNFVLPSFLFDNSQIIFEYEFDSVSNKLVFTSLDDNSVVGTVSMGADVPYCDYYTVDCKNEIKDSEFFWFYDGSSIFIMNLKKFLATSGNNYNFSFKVDYEIVSSIVSPMVETGVYPYVTFAGNDSIDLASMSSILKLPADQYFAFDNLLSNEVEVFNEWQSAWGVASYDADFYLKYSASVDVKYAGDYHVSFSPYIGEGTIVASSKDDVTYDDALTNETGYYCDVDNTGAATVKCYFIVAFELYDPQSSVYTYFTLNIDGNDGENYVSEYVEWNYEYFPEDGDTPSDVEYPIGISQEHEHSLKSVMANVGALNKLNNGDSVNFEWLMESASSNVALAPGGYVKTFNLWNLTNEGIIDYKIELENTGGVIESSYSNSENTYTLTSDDYYIESFYPQDDVEYDYYLDIDKYKLNVVMDASTYSDKEVYVKINDGNYELIGSYKLNEEGNISYVANDSRTTSRDMVNKLNPVLLPQNVTDIKVVYTGKRAAVYMGININTVLNSTKNVKDHIASLKSSNLDVVLKNNSALVVNLDNIENKNAATILTGIESETNVISSSKVNDNLANGSDSISYSSSVYEQINYDGDSTYALDNIKEQLNGSFYELLPIGVTNVTNVKVTKYGQDSQSRFDKIVTDNFEGSGRTLLMVIIREDTENIYDTGSSLQSGYTLTYTVEYSNQANQSYGNVLKKDFGYYGSQALSSGYKNASEAPSNLFSDSTSQGVFAKLNTGNSEKSTTFKNNVTTVSAISVTIGDYNKEAKNESDDSYLENTNVLEGRKYSYRLQYVFSSEFEEVENMIFVDKIESENGTSFKGTFDSIDTTYLNNLGVNTTIYYSTKFDVDIDNLDITDSAVWSTVKPSNVSTITAVAVDCGSYVFKGSEHVTPMIYINMKAPNSYVSGTNKKTVNKSVVKYNNVGNASVKSIISDAVNVSLVKAPISISATSSSGTGALSQPIIVDKNYDYVIKIKNDSSYDYENVAIDMLLPTGIKFDSISEVSTNNNTVNGSVDTSQSGKVVYNMTKLLAGEEKTITLKIKINVEDVNEGSIFEFKAMISKIAGNNYNSDYVKVYNRVAIPILEFKKYVQTLDSVDYTDEAVSLITKGEEYSYKIKVSNTSSITANGIKVVDNVPVGLNVLEDSITNGGIYSSSENTITWNLASLLNNTSVDLTYSVVVPDDATMGTIYKSSGKVTLVNPLDQELMLYDDETNIVSTLYQVASDLAVTNILSGKLADNNKLFNYVVEFDGDVSNSGAYDVQDKNGSVIKKLTIDTAGKGTLNISLKGGESFKIKLLPGGINYVIKQQVEEGYIVSGAGTTIDGGYAILSGTTDDKRLVTYEFTNSYSVSTKISLHANVRYDRTMSADMFKLKLEGNGHSEEKGIDQNGLVNFGEIVYDNVVGTFEYTVSQVNTGVSKTEYDKTVYNVKVHVTNDGKGKLNTKFEAFKNGSQVTELIFNNKYLPAGLTISNVNTSLFVDNNKNFEYNIAITNGVKGTYKVNKNGSESLKDLEINEDGTASYDFKLKSGEKVTVLELPAGTDYVITQKLLDYYTSTAEGGTANIDQTNKVITITNKMFDDSVQVVFSNNYETKASYVAKVKVTLNNRELEDKEFKFILKEISKVKANGQILYADNNTDGDVIFEEMIFDQPGEYKFEISQVKGVSNHIKYDDSKILLTLLLTDNGDGTMSILDTYQYEEEKNGFVNEYSETPIIPDDEKSEDDEIITDNPDTNDRFTIIIAMLVCIIMLFLVERKIKRRRFEMRF